MPNSDGPRIYVASLSDYNAGTLHGKWIDADQSAEDIQADGGDIWTADAPSGVYVFRSV